MKVIMLDIDGVLNYETCKVRLNGQIFVEDSKIRLLQKLVKRTGAKLVLSSTWKIGWFDLDNGIDSGNARDFIALRNKLQEYGLEFLDKTPMRTFEGRGEEIDLWLNSWKGEKIENFVILDDMESFLLQPHADRLVRTSIKTGLLPKHIKVANKILKTSYLMKKGA